MIDFSDLQENTSKLGKYIAEQITVDLVMTNRSFEVLDRANLNRILAEHKLTAKGLIDPENCKKLGMFAGVDAIILGKIIPKGESISLTAKVIATETSVIAAADKATFKLDNDVKQLMAQLTVGSNAGGGSSADSDSVKSFGDFRVELQSLQPINGGSQYLLTLSLANQSANKSIWVALDRYSEGVIRDANGFEFMIDNSHVSGIPITMAIGEKQRNIGVVMSTVSPAKPDQFNQATEIKPGESLPVTVKSLQGQRLASTGLCSVQLIFLLSSDFKNGIGNCTSKILTAKIMAE